MISGFDGKELPKSGADPEPTGDKKHKKKEKSHRKARLLKVTSESPEGSETGLRSSSDEETQTEHQKKGQRKSDKPEASPVNPTESTILPPERKKLLTKAKGRFRGTVPSQATQATQDALESAHLRYEVNLAQLEGMKKDALELTATLDEWLEKYKGLFTKAAMRAPGYLEFHKKFRALKKRYTQYTNEHAEETLAMRRLDQKYISEKLDDASLHLYSPVLLAITKYFGASFTERAPGARSKIPIIFKLSANAAISSFPSKNVTRCNL